MASPRCEEDRLDRSSAFEVALGPGDLHGSVRYRLGRRDLEVSLSPYRDVRVGRPDGALVGNLHAGSELGHLSGAASIGRVWHFL